MAHPDFQVYLPHSAEICLFGTHNTATHQQMHIIQIEIADGLAHSVLQLEF